MRLAEVSSWVMRRCLNNFMKGMNFMTKFLKRPISILLAVLMIAGIFTALPLTAYAAPTETLLTTITATGIEQASYSTANVATVSFSYLPDCGSAYLATWGW